MNGYDSSLPNFDGKEQNLHISRMGLHVGSVNAICELIPSGSVICGDGNISDSFRVDLPYKLRSERSLFLRAAAFYTNRHSLVTSHICSLLPKMAKVELRAF